MVGEWYGAIGMARCDTLPRIQWTVPTGPRAFAIWDASIPRVECRWRSASIRPVEDTQFGGPFMRLLITGGAGFIGSNLAKLALANDVEVTILDDLSTGYRENIQDLDVAFIEGSILDVDAVRKSLVGVGSVIHLAARGSVPRSIEDPLASHAAKATGTLTVLDEARQAGVEHFVVSSSSSVYGMNPALPKSEREWVRPMSPYARFILSTHRRHHQWSGIRSSGR